MNIYQLKKFYKLKNGKYCFRKVKYLRKTGLYLVYIKDKLGNGWIEQRYGFYNTQELTFEETILKAKELNKDNLRDHLLTKLVTER